MLFLATLALVILTWPPRQLDCGAKKAFFFYFEKENKKAAPVCDCDVTVHVATIGLPRISFHRQLFITFFLYTCLWQIVNTGK